MSFLDGLGVARPHRRELAALRQLALALLRQVAPVIPLIAIVGGGSLVVHQFGAQVLSDGFGGLADISTSQWLIAAALTFISLFAAGRLEGAAHRLIATGVPHARATRTGRTALAISQATGLAALTSAAIRKRMLPNLSLPTVAGLTSLVSLGYLAGVALFCGLFTLGIIAGPFVAAIAGAAIIGATLPWIRPTSVLPGLRKRTALSFLGWLAVDIFAAAGVLAVLLPAGTLAGLATFIAGYTGALVVGFVGQSPGGLGGFDAALLSALPGVPAAALMTAVIGYRLVYILIPALLTLPNLLATPVGHSQRTPLAPLSPRSARRAFSRAQSALWGLIDHGATVLSTPDHETAWLTRRAGGSLVAIGSPLGLADPADLASAARADSAAPLLYKGSGRDALRARQAGWTVLPIAADAIIDLADWTLDGRARRSLRRKLSKARQANVRVEIDPINLPMRDMQDLSHRWAARCGGERGFSTGRFCPLATRRQRVCLAYVGGELAAFVTFFWNGRDWYLDLIRHDDATPDGTIHALICAAIDEAKLEGAETLNLASVTAPTLRDLWPSWLMKASRTRIDGLTQFKRAFAPRWQTRYAAAPTRIGLLIGLWDTFVAIRHSAPAAQIAAPDMVRPENPIVPATPSCDPHDNLFSKADAMIRARHVSLGELFNVEPTCRDARNQRVGPR